MKLTKKSMKSSIASLLMGMGVLTITACAESELTSAPNEAWQNDPDALRISATVGGAFGSNGAATRTNPMGDMTDIADGLKGDQTAFNPGDQIGVYTDDQAEVLYTLSADGTTWEPEAGKYQKWTGNTMQVYAYYPVTSFLDWNNTTVKNSAQTFALPTGQGSLKNIAGADYMTFNRIATRPDNGSANLSLPMQRRTARVIINISSVGDEIDKANNRIIEPEIRSLYKTYANNVASGNETRSVTAYVDREGTDGFATRFTALVIPATKATESPYGSWLNIPVMNKESGNVRFFKVKEIPAMEAGKSYTYNLKLGKDKVTITGITVQDWTTGATLPDGQEAEESGWFSEELTEALLTADQCTDADGNPIGLSFNKNANGEINPFDATNKAELEKIKMITINNLNSLHGIEYLTELTRLDCIGSTLTTLDVSGLTKLTYLDCNKSSSLTTLNVSGLTSLKALNCSNCALTELNTSDLETLTVLNCSGNQLTTLDTSKLTSLTRLLCNNNQLTALDVSGLTILTNLTCYNNQLTTLDASGLTSLKNLTCDNNMLTALTLPNNSILSNLTCTENRLSAIDISPYSSLESLLCGSQTSDGSTLQQIDVTATAEQVTAFNNGSNTTTYGVYFITKQSE